MDEQFEEQTSESVETKKTIESTNKYKNKKVDKNAKFKEDYFAFYDDIKNHTKGREDW